MYVNDNVKRICKEKNISFADLAEKIGVTRQTLYNQTENNPSLQTIERIAAALGVSVADLVRRDTTTPENGLICPHCGKPLHIELTK